ALTIRYPAAASLADEEWWPKEYKKLTTDRRFVFVMLPPKEWQRYGRLYPKYQASGLYRNDGTQNRYGLSSVRVRHRHLLGRRAPGALGTLAPTGGWLSNSGCGVLSKRQGDQTVRSR